MFSNFRKSLFARAMLAGAAMNSGAAATEQLFRIVDATAKTLTATGTMKHHINDWGARFAQGGSISGNSAIHVDPHDARGTCTFDPKAGSGDAAADGQERVEVCSLFEYASPRRYYRMIGID
jgi:hypothetical protein